MGLMDEFEKGREWIANNLDMGQMVSDLKRKYEFRKLVTLMPVNAPGFVFKIIFVCDMTWAY